MCYGNGIGGHGHGSHLRRPLAAQPWRRGGSPRRGMATTEAQWISRTETTGYFRMGRSASAAGRSRLQDAGTGFHRAGSRIRVWISRISLPIDLFLASVIDLTVEA